MRNDEKRTITSPITDHDGNISLFQLLWKGTADLCSGNCTTRHFATYSGRKVPPPLGGCILTTTSPLEPSTTIGLRSLTSTQDFAFRRRHWFVGSQQTTFKALL